MTDALPGTVVPSRQGKAWSVEEDRQLYDAFMAGQSVDTLASAHERNAGGIRARLGRLGLIDQDGVAVAPAPPFAAATRRRSRTPAGHPSAAEDDTPPSIFAIRADDGWVVEVKSNRPLSRSLVDRLTSMLHGVLPTDDTQ